MDASNRDIKVIIEQLSPNLEAQDIDNSDDNQWFPVGERWAEFMSRGSREFYRAKQQQDDVTDVVRMHWDSLTTTLTAEMRLRVKTSGAIHQIASTPYDVDHNHRTVEFTVIG